MAQPFGNLNELRFSGINRVFFYVPASIYGPIGIAGTSYLGAGLSGQRFDEDGWAFGFDLYGGAVNVEEQESYAGLIESGAPAPVAETSLARDAVGGRIWLTAPGDLTARLSGYTGRLSEPDGDSRTFQSWALSLHHIDRRFRVGAELAYREESGREHAWGGYLFATAKLHPKFQAGLRYERLQTWLHSYLPLPGYGPSSPLLRHQAIGLAVNYIYGPNLLFKAEYQVIDGNRLAFPQGQDAQGVAWDGDHLAQATLARRTGVLVVGTQFAF